jgi:hypothetical protein
MNRPILSCVSSVVLLLPLISRAADDPKKAEAAEIKACADMTLQGFRKIAAARGERFEGKVVDEAALCRGGQRTLQFRLTPWVDWSNY